MPVDDSSSSGFTLEFHVGGINASNSRTTTSSESGPSQARFACRRLAIFNESDHLLMQRVAANLLTQLDDLEGFQQVQYYPYGVRPEPGELAPDVTVSLQLDEISSSGFAPARKLNAQVRLTAASTLLGCPSHHYSDGLNPPAVEFDMTDDLGPPFHLRWIRHALSTLQTGCCRHLEATEQGTDRETECAVSTNKGHYPICPSRCTRRTRIHSNCHCRPVSLSSRLRPTMD